MLEKESIDQDDRAYLARNMADGAAVGAVGASSLGLLYMLYRSLEDKYDAEKRKVDVKGLSVNPLEAGDPLKGMKKDSAKDDGIMDSIKSIPGNMGQGAVMYPLAAAALAVPAYFMYKKLHDMQDSSEADRLKQELEQAREDFSQALEEGSKVSCDIDEFLRDKEADPNNTNNPHPILDMTGPKAESMFGRFGGTAGLTGGAISLTAISSALLSFMALNRYLSGKNKSIKSVEALNELQRRRRALNEIAPSLNIKQAPKSDTDSSPNYYVDF